MRKVKLTAALIVFILLSVAVCVSQSVGSSTQTSSQPAATSSVAAPDSDLRGTFPAVLVKSLDSKKLKDGDVVICQTSGVMHARSGLMIPTGSKVIGHVTQAKARSKGDSDSSLAMVFDKIEVSKGKEIPMTGVLQAVAPSLGSSGPDTGVAGGGQMIAGHGDATTMPPPTTGSVAGPNSGYHPLNSTGSRPVLNSQSMGVLGIRNLQMDKDSVLTSSGKEVKLENGTQMMIRADIKIPAE
jgi:hypothetical protein